MAQTTNIEWCDLTWNPVFGCSKVSPGCAHCYAAEIAGRFKLTAKPWTPGNAAENVTVKPHKLREPLSNARAWRGLGTAAAAAGKTDGKLVFVNSMSDLFHEEIPNGFIHQVFEVMREARRHTFQVLTKRPERMQALLSDWASREVAMAPGMPWWKPPANVWLGVSIENRRFVHRADVLRRTPAAVRFISAEPLLGPLVAPSRVWTTGIPYDEQTGDPDDFFWQPNWADDYNGPELNLEDIDWCIVGGESGPRYRPMRFDWARDLREACLDQPGLCEPECPRCAADGERRRTAFFLKQLGGPRPGGEALLDGREWREFPQVGA